MDFDMLGLEPRLIAQLAEQGITDPTPIQAQAIPHALNGRDVMGLAQTGTGKTAAFGLPMADMLLKAGKKPDPKTVRGLILAPTRELANQIADNLKAYVHGTPVKVNIVVGGVSLRNQITRLARGTDLLVATPGRLIDLLDQRALTLSETQFLVLDEADQMLDLGFIHSLRKIAALLPAQRQTMLFSATMPKQMGEIADAYLTDPVKVQVSPPGKAADKIDQSIHFVPKAHKTEFLIEDMRERAEETTLVFARTKHGCERLMKQLVRAGYKAASIHGNKSQGQRERALQSFRDGETKILVATDVAARGIDIPGVRFVYNFDLPNVPDNYVHRIGRTARAGADGTAIALCAPDEMGQLKDIQKTMKFTIPVASGRPWEPMEEEKPKARRGGRGGSGGGGNRGRGRGAPRGDGAAPAASDAPPSPAPKPKPQGKPQGKPGGGKPGGGGGNRNRGKGGGKPGGGGPRRGAKPGGGGARSQGGGQPPRRK